MYLTITGLLSYFPALFDLFKVPDGLNRQTAIDNICFEYAENAVIYSNPELMRKMIGVWSAKNAYKWSRLSKTTTLEYNPIENYNRHEEWADFNSESGEVSENHTGSTNTNGTGNGLEKRKGFEGGNLVETAGTENVNNVDTSAKDDVKGTNMRTGKAGHTGHFYGNIGVTTTQQMIKSEREIAEFSIYDVIAEDFAQEFCLYVY